MSDILILTPWFPNSRGGWPAPFVSDSACALAQFGHQVRVIVFRGYVPRFAERLASREHRGKVDRSSFPELESLIVVRRPTLPRGLLRKQTNYVLDWTIGRAIRRAVCERRPDVIIAHTEELAPKTTSLATRLRIPTIVTLHGENTNPDYISNEDQAFRFQRGLSSANRLVIVGQPLRTFAEALSGRQDHIRIVGNGIHAPSTRREHSSNEHAPIELITVANFHESKGLHYLIDALHELNREGVKPWRLRIIGDGPLRDSLHTQVRDARLTDQIDFLGVRTNRQVYDALFSSEVFVLPSYKEAFGMAYLEAMSVGLLAIGVKGEGPAQFIEHGKTGLLVEPRSIASLVETLRRVLNGPRAQWMPIARSGKMHVLNNCTWRVHAERMTALINEVTIP